MSYEEENQELGMHFLQRYFDTWKGNSGGNWNGIEFQTTFSCALNCKYCYLHKYEDSLEPMGHDSSRILENGKMLMDWLVENDYSPRIDFFGGSPFVFDENFELLDYMLDKSVELEEPGNIVVPSSYVWIDDEERTEKVEGLIEKSKKVGANVFLSASVDGKYCDANRPTPIVDRDEEYYDKIFRFNKKYGFGYHPMIYCDHIEDWEDNWLWYMQKLQEFNQHPSRMYLLEVRNPEWGVEEIKEYGDFVQFLLDWTYWYYSYNNERFFKFIFDDGFNMLRPFTTTGRGLGCSTQSTVMVQLADLSINPCHRLAYEEKKLARFEKEDGKITGIDIENPAQLIGHTVTDQVTFPQCEQCTIKNLCFGGCCGANYETNGSRFVQVPTVCQLEHQKIYSMYKWYKETNLLGELYERIKDKFVREFELIAEAGGIE